MLLTDMLAPLPAIVCALWLLLLPAPARAAQPSSVPAAIVVDAGKVEGAISPALYGQFDEIMYEGVKRGLYAELLRDRGFEGAPDAAGLPRYWERAPDDRNDDSALRFHWDDSVFYPPPTDFKTQNVSHSLRVDVDAADGQPRGIRQGGIPVRQAVPYHGYLWLKTSGFQGHVTVALQADQTGGTTYAAADLANIAGDWKKYEFTLTPGRSDPLARFGVLFYGRGRLWLDQVSLLPGDAVDGVRRDVFEKIKALRPAFIRWPGGNVAQDYHWMWGIGPRDRRTTWVNLSWGNEREPSDFGTDEFVQLCRNVGAEPSLTVNVEGRGATAQEAAAWVEYANGAPDSKYGALRAADGHTAPFHVKYWEVGNEIWGSWVRGHSDAETYARNFLRYAQAMRAVDPSIRLIAVGDNNLDWDRTVLRLAGSQIDYLAIHHYYGGSQIAGDPLNLMAHPLGYEAFYRQVEELIRQLAPGRDIKLAINEWNTSLPLPAQHSMESALYGARLMNVFERSDVVALSAVSDLVNGWPGGIIQASRHGVYVTPTYLVNQLYSEDLGTQRLAARVQSPEFDNSREGKGVPYLDVVASRAPDQKRLFIKAVNTDPRRDLATTVRITGAEIAPRGILETVNGASEDAANSFATPGAVSIHRSEFRAGASFTVTLPSHSVSVLVLNLAASQP